MPRHDSRAQQQQEFCCLCREHVACLGGALHLENSSPLIAGNNLHASTFLLFSSFHIQTILSLAALEKKNRVSSGNKRRRKWLLPAIFVFSFNK
jgi:hypothetical protein